jgi:predicted house-cleaning noncanonical NTP pyrophosphatase (MazG superfamily)
VIDEIDEIEIISNSDKPIHNEGYQEELMSKTNEQLKTILRLKNLSTKGQKAELVKRLIEN